MKRARDPRGGGDRKINLNASGGKSEFAFKAGPPLVPRRKLLAGLLVCFAAWMAVLLALYSTTIDPPQPPAGDNKVTR